MGRRYHSCPMSEPRNTLERELQAKLFASEDAKEGLTAYNQKRKAEFKGR